MKIDTTYITDTIGDTETQNTGPLKYINRNTEFYPYANIVTNWDLLPADVSYGDYIIKYLMWITTSATNVFAGNGDWWYSFMGLVEYNNKFNFGYIQYSYTSKQYYFTTSNSTYAMDGRFVNSSTNKSYYINSKEILDLESKLNKHGVTTIINTELAYKKVERNKLESN